MDRHLINEEPDPEPDPTPSFTLKKAEIFADFFLQQCQYIFFLFFNVSVINYTILQISGKNIVSLLLVNRIQIRIRQNDADPDTAK